ncbi:uncharacterized protein LOC131037889 [Cryptomeria japonica]|uniref:uncharacterized protein LOC131037889 n=1 Tax=Cryptomeria japonica TaxID=3369 RepID=UPI0027D9F3E0|nr:uncharacterized protein LOC131037889 [Cryptomeria japonica]
MGSQCQKVYVAVGKDLLQCICSQAKVKAKALIVMRADVRRGIVEMISKDGIAKLIMGTSSAGGAKSTGNLQTPSLFANANFETSSAEDYGGPLSLQPNIQLYSAAPIETPENFSDERGFTLDFVRDNTPDKGNQSGFDAISGLSCDIKVAEPQQIDGHETQESPEERTDRETLKIVLTEGKSTNPISGLSCDIKVAEPQRIDGHETQESPEERTDRKRLKIVLREASEVAENASREVHRETVGSKNAKAAAMESSDKFRAIEAALQHAILVSKMKEEHCQELTRRLKEMEEELQAMVDNDRLLSTQLRKFSHDRHQAIQELHAVEEKLAAVRMQNCCILKEKDEEIKELQDLLHCRSRLEDIPGEFWWIISL